eukprot:768016-Hanusia_phi.AAC.8
MASNNKTFGMGSDSQLVHKCHRQNTQPVIIGGLAPAHLPFFVLFLYVSLVASLSLPSAASASIALSTAAGKMDSTPICEPSLPELKSLSPVISSV